MKSRTVRSDKRQVSSQLTSQISVLTNENTIRDIVRQRYRSGRISDLIASLRRRSEVTLSTHRVENWFSEVLLYSFDRSDVAQAISRQKRRELTVDEAQLMASKIRANAHAAEEQRVFDRKKKLMRFVEKQAEATWLQQESLLSVLPLYDCLFSDIGVPALDRAYFRRRATSEGWPFVADILPRLEKALLKGLASGKFDNIEDFITKRGTSLPRFLYSLFSEVFRDDGKLKKIDDASPIAVQQLRQILGFCYKADVPCDVERELNAVQRFVEVELELEKYEKSYSTRSLASDPIIVTASLLLDNIFRDYTKANLSFRHGPGVTSDVPKVEKYEQALPPIRSASGKWTSCHFFNDTDQASRAWREPVLNSQDLFESPNCARLILVPKDSRGPRVISAEPASNQWIQQGIRGYLYDTLENHAFTRGQIGFRDQSVNQAKAREASMTQVWSTLDLKDASDRVSTVLVKAIFARCPELLSDILDVRSDFTVLPDGRRLFLRKHAPMGSALCFPVLAVTIWSILVSGLIGLGETPDFAMKSITVYGDDLVVPTMYADFCIRLLERYSLRVNRDKCFIGGRFAESCGEDYFDGNSVNVVRLRSCPTSQEGNGGISPSLSASLVETANQLTRLGYESVSTYLYSFVERYLGLLPSGYQHSSFLNRNFLKFQGQDAWSVTMHRPLFKKQFAKTGFVRAVVSRPSKVKADWTSFGGHLLRIHPLLGTANVPLPGEFDGDSTTATFSRARFDENDFTPYEANRWPHGPSTRNV